MSNPLRERVFVRSQGICQCAGACGLHAGRCTTEITLETFHQAHLRARTHGGILHESNLEAWCSRCNLTLNARDARDPRVAPREWQLRELDKVVGAIARNGAATLSAAPGAGKTLFGGFVFEALREAGYVERMVVVVPRRGLADQWTDALASGRHIQLKPHSAIERSSQHGVAVTYQSLPNRDSLDAHKRMARNTRTLLVLDEVHHLSQDRSWGDAVAELAHDVAGVLNLSGTLWRSKQNERIATVQYTLPDAEGRISSLVDGEVTVEELIRIGQLRSLDLHKVGTRISVADYAHLTLVEGNLADVDEKPARAAVAALGEIDSWREAFVASVLDKLEKAHRHLDHHVKALIVAANQKQARLFRDEVDRQMRQRGLQPLAALAISDEDDAQRRLESFRAQQRVGVLCTVDMAGEGYDCPDIAILGYASNKLTPLYVRQVIARAMRVTDRERELDAILPATVVLPDSRPLIEKFLEYTAPYTHDVLEAQTPVDTDRGRAPDGPTGPRFQRYVLEDAAAAGETITVSFLDGTHEDVDAEYAAVLRAHLVEANVPESFWPRATAVMQRTIGDLLRRKPFDFDPQPAGVHTSEPSEESKAQMLQKRLAKLAGWWKIHGDTPVSHFNREVNQAAGIRAGARGEANILQLKRALQFAEDYIRRYRERAGDR